MKILLNNIQSKTELLSQLKEQLKFPSYFGMNWDALSDSLGEVVRSKMEQIEICLVDDSLPKEDFEMFLKICVEHGVTIKF